jgi:L,D-transpeptidase catalytic domain
MRRFAVTVFTAFSLLAGVGTARAQMDVIVNKSTQQMSVVIDGSVRYIWNISTGRDADSTPNGTFAPEHLERIWFSRRYYNSPMPYAIFFHNGYAIHGSNAIDRLGGPASHGCVRLHPEHAAILFDLVQREGPENTRIIITGATIPKFQPAPPPNRGPRPPRDLNDLIESLQDQCNPKTVTGPGNRPNPACETHRPTDGVADTRPDQTPAPASSPTPSPDQPADQQQSHAGYRLLPKSYWSGAAWRWRLGLGPDQQTTSGER